MYPQSLQLTDPPADSAIANGLAWIESAALGPVATSVAAIAVATIGLLMLSGRLDLRRGVSVVLGCFILFGASGIAAALTDPTNREKPPRQSMDFAPNPLSSQLQLPARPSTAYDPYAGASVLMRAGQ